MVYDIIRYNAELFDVWYPISLEHGFIQEKYFLFVSWNQYLMDKQLYNSVWSRRNKINLFERERVWFCFIIFSLRVWLYIMNEIRTSWPTWSAESCDRSKKKYLHSILFSTTCKCKFLPLPLVNLIQTSHFGLDWLFYLYHKY